MELRGELPTVVGFWTPPTSAEATGQLWHAAMSSSSRDGGSQSSDVEKPETTTTTNQSAALSSAVAKANEATEQSNRLKTELRRATNWCHTQGVEVLHGLRQHQVQGSRHLPLVRSSRGTQLRSGSLRICHPRT